MAVYLRVKRPSSDSCALDSFEAKNLLKKFRTEPGTAPSDLSVFRYIGSHLQKTDVTTDFLDSLHKVDADGVGRLTVDSTLRTTVSRGKLDRVGCEVRIKTMKRVAPDFSSLEDERPLPCKLFRIIDIIPHGTDDQLPVSFASIQLSPSETKRLSPNDSDFVYDFYRLEKRRLLHPSSGSGPTELSSCVREDEIDFGDADEEEEYGLNVDDEDDSNSESNWRNDYPDEESQTDSELDSDPSSRCSSRCTSDEDSYYYHSTLYRAL